LAAALLLFSAIRAGWEPWARASRPTRVVGLAEVAQTPLTIVVHDAASGEPRYKLAGLRVRKAWRTAASRWLAEEVDGRRVVCVVGRAGLGEGEAMVYLVESGVFVNEAMVDAGYADVDPLAGHELRAWLAQVRGWAASAGRGLWGADGDADGVSGVR